MIEIAGPENNQEYTAAQRLKELLLEWDPTLRTGQDRRATIVVRAKCPGGLPAEIDLLLILATHSGGTFPAVDAPGSPADFRFLCLTIEQKSHSYPNVAFRGSSALVRYDGEWQDVSEQVNAQMQALKRYLRAMHLAPDIFVASCGWLTNVPQGEMPSGTLTLGADASFEDFLRVAVLGGWHPSKRTRPDKHANIASDWTDAELLRDHFAVARRVSRMDRNKVEAYNQQWLEGQKYVAEVGKRLLILRGAPGTGKTTALLRISQDLIRERGARVLFLTYNLALAADIRRHLTLQPERWHAADHGSLGVDTTDHFFRELARLGQIDVSGTADVSYEENYQRILTELSILTGDSKCAEQVRTACAPVDVVLVDEGQDWKEGERRVLFNVFGHDSVVVAEGVLQHVFSAKPLDWRGNLPLSAYKVFQLKKVRRQLTGLYQFVDAFVRAAGISGNLTEPSRELAGGRVIIAVGPYDNARLLHDELTSELRHGGGELLDMLVLVPPATNVTDADGKSHSQMAQRLREWGGQVWDGTRQDVRREPPKSLAEVRVVNYQSARGLEAWTVVACDLDEQYRFLYKRALQDGFSGDLIQSAEDAARDHAFRQLLIPLTRPAHTMCITLRSPDGPVGQALKAAHASVGEIAEWRDLR